MKNALCRRSLLKGFGAALALPFLEAMVPTRLHAEAKPKPRRMLAVCNNLGLIPENFFPAQGGRDYEPTPYLKVLEKHRPDFTVFSGVSHPDVDGGHNADICFLSAAPHPGRSGFRNTISLDQFAAERIGVQTRFPSMTLGVNVDQGNRSMSWTGSGVLIPCEEKASEVFRRLFMQGTPAEMAAQERKLELGASILDSVAGQAKGLQKNLGPRDRDRIDQYFTSVRDLESRMAMQKEWERKPKPVITAKEPSDPASPKEYMEKTRLMYDMARLAFETDSCRLITLFLDSVNSPAIDVEGVHISDGYHNLSHHGRSKEKLEQLKAIDEGHMKLLDGLFSGLKSVHEEEQTLLDRTMILYGTNLGNANTHVTTNLPTLFAGGGFKHGQHLAFSKERNYPLTNLFVSMLQRLGIEADKFGPSTGTMKGLEMA